MKYMKFINYNNNIFPGDYSSYSDYVLDDYVLDDYVLDDYVNTILNLLCDKFSLCYNEECCKFMLNSEYFNFKYVSRSIFDDNNDDSVYIALFPEYDLSTDEQDCDYMVAIKNGAICFRRRVINDDISMNYIDVECVSLLDNDIDNKLADMFERFIGDYNDTKIIAEDYHK